MGTTNLIDFLQNLVGNPQDLRSYKQDPAAYLEKIHLSQQEKEMLLTISALSPVMEVSTVFRVNVASPSQTQPASQDADTVDLAGTSVVIMSRNTPLIAEATGKQGLQYRLLKHSYVNPTRGTPFELHICYVDPNDPTDQPFVLQIKTDEQAPNPQPNRSDITVTLQSNRPIVLTYDTPISCTLQPGSTYNRSSGELTLNIDNLPTDET